MALAGIRVVEMAGLAPAPFCGMILADFGAHVTRVDRLKAQYGADTDRLTRGKRNIGVDLKSKMGVDIVRRLCDRSDVLIEPFRPGVMEKIGIGPKILMQSNPRLIYARLTGYGQNGAYRNLAGHDINYLAISGLLSMLGRAGEKPYAPLNLLADFAGGGLMCAFRILLAVLERQKTGVGKLIDHSMVEGAAYVGSWVFCTQDVDLIWPKKRRGENLLDGGCPVYDTYETSDGKYVAVGALEPQFHTELFQKLGLDLDTSDIFADPDKVKRLLTERFRAKTRDEWAKIFDSSEACVTPVLELQEVGQHVHNKERGSFFEEKGQHEYPWVPKPEPGKNEVNVSGNISSNSPTDILLELGYSEQEIRDFDEKKVVDLEGQEKNRLSKL